MLRRLRDGRTPAARSVHIDAFRDARPLRLRDHRGDRQVFGRCRSRDDRERVYPVSLDPFLVLVCVEKVARFHEAVLESGRWAVSVLGENAIEASNWFATRGRPLAGQLSGFPFTRGEESGAALLADALATIECGTIGVYDGGDHDIVVGEVLSVAVPRPDDRPLVYFQGKYHVLGDAT